MVIVSEMIQTEEHKMSDYNSMMITRAEHHEMIRSLPSVPEYGLHLQDAQPGWMARQAERLLCHLVSGLSSLGEWLKHGRDGVLEASLTGQEQSSLPR